MKNILFLFLLLAQSLVAQVSFEARTNRSAVPVNDMVRVDFTMNGDGDNFKAPSFAEFKQAHGPSTSVQQSWFNGKSTFTKTYTYYLAAPKEGKYTIGAATVEIEGVLYKTQPITVQITAPVQKSQPGVPGQISTEDLSKELQLVAEVSKGNPYVNEPVTVTYKLYVSDNIGVRNWRELESPKYNDFWTQSIDVRDLRPERGELNGQSMRYLILRRTVLYPQKSGKLAIAPLVLEVDTQVPTGRRDFFGRPQIAEKSLRVQAGARHINAMALPEQGRPEFFSGAVGQFEFETKLTKSTLKYGESAELVVSISGDGNFKLFDLPKPKVPAAIEMYEPVTADKVQTTVGGMKGKISSTYTLVPSYEGNYTIEGLPFAYFDYKKGKYITVTSEDLTLRVTDGPGVAQGAPAAQAGVQKQEVAAQQAFQFIRTEAKWEDKNRSLWLGSGMFFAILALPFIAMLLLVVLRKKKEAMDRDVEGNRLRKSNMLAKKYLSQAKSELGNKEAFYVALEKSIYNFLKAKLNVMTSEMSKENIVSLLESKQISEATRNQFTELMSSLELARYAPSTDSSMQQDYERAVALINELSKSI